MNAHANQTTKELDRTQDTNKLKTTTSRNHE